MLQYVDDNIIDSITDAGLIIEGEHQLVITDNNKPAGLICYNHLPFETKYLEINSFRLYHPQSLNNNVTIIDDLVFGCIDCLSNNKCEFLFSRINSLSTPVVCSLQKAGFTFIECLVTLKCEISNNKLEMPDFISIASEGDFEVCSDIARHAFIYDRFHSDQDIDNAKADIIKNIWVENAFKGRADSVFVANDGGKVVGFITCLLKQDTVVIDLIAVDAEVQGHGWGVKLIHAAFCYYSGKVSYMQAGTQSHNFASLKLYQSMNFKFIDSEFTFHKHFN